MRMSNMKPMKNTMRKQSPMKMVGDATAATTKTKPSDGKTGVTSKAELSAARKSAKETSNKANKAAVRAVLEKNMGTRTKPAAGFAGAARAALERRKAQKEVTAAKRADTTKVEGPKPKPPGAAPKAATTKTNPGTTKTNLSTTKTAPTMMKKMGKSSCGK